MVFTLRQPWDHLPIAITHVGITIPARAPTMRRASRRMGKRVVRDDKLAWYMKHLGTYSNWPAAGLIVLAPGGVRPGVPWQRRPGAALTCPMNRGCTGTARGALSTHVDFQFF
ncbi:MAG: hypothetical protein H6740_01330 [Alphaproteobacteria bacterium]|nr:hypothetical protein [Alphaproteobacteria bacterium]